MKPKTPFKSDKYKKARGGYSRLLDIGCAKCGAHLCFYQKDGPGMLKRMYLDRIFDDPTWAGLQSLGLKEVPQFTCGSCKTSIGVPMNYEKENRLAFRLFQGAVTKKIVKSPR